MGIYTRTGDGGTAALPGGRRLSKSDQAFEALGSVDELNAHLGSCRAACGRDHESIACGLAAVQSELLSLGALLAAALGGASAPQAIPTPDVARLEREIDAATQAAGELKHFVLPNGCELACRLHLARTVCRRAERRAASLDASTAAATVPYLNRLSDWLFAQARLANKLAGAGDEPWPPATGRERA